MTLQLFTNNAVSLLQTPLSSSGLSIAVQPGLGNLFPQPTLPNEYFLVTLEDIAAPSQREIIKIVGRSGDFLTVAGDGRGQEGTTPRAWPANDTLIDHRITAETIKQAFLQPVSTGGGSYTLPIASSTVLGGVKIGSGITVSPDGTISAATGGGGGGSYTLPVATATVLGGVKQGSGIVIAADGTISTSGTTGGVQNTDPVIIESVTTEGIAEKVYSNFKRGHKFWVTLYAPSNSRAQTFEVLCAVQGSISTNTETVDWTRTNRVGYNFAGNITVALDKPNNKLQLSWFNTENYDVIASIVYI